MEGAVGHDLGYRGCGVTALFVAFSARRGSGLTRSSRGSEKEGLAIALVTATIASPALPRGGGLMASLSIITLPGWGNVLSGVSSEYGSFFPGGGVASQGILRDGETLLGSLVKITRSLAVRPTLSGHQPAEKPLKTSSDQLEGSLTTFSYVTL